MIDHDRVICVFVHPKVFFFRVTAVGFGCGIAICLMAIWTLLWGDFKFMRPYSEALKANERLFAALRAPMLPTCTMLTDAIKAKAEGGDEIAVERAIAEYAMRLNGKLNRSMAEKIAHALCEAAMRNGLDACLLAAVVALESSFNPEARSPSGAMGLAQLMPQTASMLGVSDPYDIAQNLNGAACYIAMLLNRWRNQNNAFEMALASYRLGPRVIELRLGIPDVMGIASYLKDVLHHYNELRELTVKAAQSNLIMHVDGE